MPQTQQNKLEISFLVNSEPHKPELLPPKIDGRGLQRKSVGPTAISGVDTGTITKVMMTADSVGKNQLDYETASLAFGAADVSATATVTNGSVVLGWYVSAYAATPASGWLKLEVSGTTLTGTLTAAPGGAATLTVTVVLLKA